MENSQRRIVARYKLAEVVRPYILFLARSVREPTPGSKEHVVAVPCRRAVEKLVTGGMRKTGRRGGVEFVKSIQDVGCDELRIDVGGADEAIESGELGGAGCVQAKKGRGEYRPLIQLRVFCQTASMLRERRASRLYR